MESTPNTGTSSATSDTDYTALAGGEANACGGETSQTVEVTVAGDAGPKRDETVMLALITPSTRA